MSNGNNSGLSALADRYALALIELGERLNQLDQFETDLSGIQEVLGANRELLTFLEHPTVTLDDKKEIVDRIFKNNVSQYVLNTLKLLLDRHRLYTFPSMVQHYIDILNRKRNITIAHVTTAIQIDEDTKNRIKDKLAKALNQTIKLNASVNPAIIAGMIIKIGDRNIDGSIRTRLENMRRQLI